MTLILRLWNSSSVKELESLSLEFQVLAIWCGRKNSRGTRVLELLPLDIGLCVLRLWVLLLLQIFLFSSICFLLYTLWNLSLIETQVLHGLFTHVSLELEFLYRTRVFKAQDASLLKCFKNMPTNKIIALIILNGKNLHLNLAQNWTKLTYNVRVRACKKSKSLSLAWLSSSSNSSSISTSWTRDPI